MSLIAWPTLGVLVGLLVTELVGWTGNRWVAALQAVAPYLLALSLPIATIALVTQRWRMMAAAVVVALVFVVLAWPLVRRPTQAEPMPGATSVRIFHANLLYDNTDDAGMLAAIESVEADVLVFTEYTPEHAAALLATPVADEHPYRIGEPRPLAAGTAIWSRYPLTGVASQVAPSRSDCVLVRVASPDPITVFGVHPTSPIVSTEALLADLGHLAAWSPPAGEGAVMIGDFNSSYWHPPFRDLLHSGWRDAHQVAGRGLSTSWPNDRRPIPAFVRLDHALVNDQLVVTAIDDVDIPGSDHIGLIVTVTTAGPAA